MRRVVLAIIVLWLSAGNAAAGHHCRVPLADWRPRDELRRILERDNWQAITIRLDDGCYKVRAKKPDGETLDALFDPGTLQKVILANQRKDDDD